MHIFLSLVRIHSLFHNLKDWCFNVSVWVGFSEVFCALLYCFRKSVICVYIFFAIPFCWQKWNNKTLLLFNPTEYILLPAEERTKQNSFKSVNLLQPRKRLCNSLLPNEIAFQVTVEHFHLKENKLQ